MVSVCGEVMIIVVDNLSSVCNETIIEPTNESFKAILENYFIAPEKERLPPTQPVASVTREEMLEKCKDVVKNRQNQHGSPEDNFSRIAALWSTYLDIELTSADVAMLMILFKIA